jgi:hypothetical protein
MQKAKRMLHDLPKIFAKRKEVTDKESIRSRPVWIDIYSQVVAQNQSAPSFRTNCSYAADDSVRGAGMTNETDWSILTDLKRTSIRFI